MHPPTGQSASGAEPHRPHVAEEFERQPVPARALQGGKSFWGMYAGEHAAGTEFMIGPLFLLAGVSLNDIFFGLLLGNFLAVLSWRYLCAPIAVHARLTLYYQLEKIAGSGLVKVYNLANGILFCFLAGAMITVSATAVGVPFGLPMPSFDAIYPESLTFVLAVLVVGAVIAVVAGFGYDAVSRFANVAVPWMVLASARPAALRAATSRGEGAGPLGTRQSDAGLFSSWEWGLGLGQFVGGGDNQGGECGDSFFAHRFLRSREAQGGDDRSAGVADRRGKAAQAGVVFLVIHRVAGFAHSDEAGFEILPRRGRLGRAPGQLSAFFQLVDKVRTEGEQGFAGRTAMIIHQGARSGGDPQ